MKNQQAAPYPIPATLHLPSLQQTWSIRTVAYLGKTKCVAPTDNQLLLLHDYNDTSQCLPILKQWLREHASRTLPPWLERVSQTCGLAFKHVHIRAQRTRWGSCSCQKAISLNYKLLFFPNAVVRYIMLHELCHTVHLNHSACFWQLVESFDPHWRQHDAILKQAHDYIPAWI